MAFTNVKADVESYRTHIDILDSGGIDLQEWRGMDLSTRNAVGSFISNRSLLAKLPYIDIKTWLTYDEDDRRLKLEFAQTVSEM